MPDSAAMDRYLGRCEAVLIRLNGKIASSALDQAQHLIDHGEPAEGMLSLAWAICEEHVFVAASEIREIRELTSDLVHPAHMPPDLDTHGIPD